MTIYRIHLTDLERAEFLSWVKKGTRKAKDIQRAQVLLASDETTGRQSAVQIAAQYHLSQRSVERIRKSFCESGMEIFKAKQRKPRIDKKIDGRVEAHLIRIACSSPPDGYGRWTLSLLAGRLVELQIVDHISHTMVSRLLKKTNYVPS